MMLSVQRGTKLLSRRKNVPMTGKLKTVTRGYKYGGTSLAVGTAALDLYNRPTMKNTLSTTAGTGVGLLTAGGVCTASGGWTCLVGAPVLSTITGTATEWGSGQIYDYLSKLSFDPGRFRLRLRRGLLQH
jgi:hypothetical protein